MTNVTRRPRLVIVDARASTDERLAAIREPASHHYDVNVVSSAEHAGEKVAADLPVAALVHAGLDRLGALPALGPFVATLCQRRAPGVPMLLYTGGNPRSHVRALAQMGLQIPVVHDRRLIDCFDTIVTHLLEHHHALEVLSKLPRPAPASPEDCLPERFGIDDFLGQVEGAFSRASLLEHFERAESVCTDAAAAVRMPHDRFVAHLVVHDIEVPRDPRPPSVTSERVLWCSSHPLPSALRAECDRHELSVRTVPPGSLEPSSVCSPQTIAAVVEPLAAGSAAEVWLLHRSVRPFVLLEPIPAPVRFVLAELGLLGSAFLAEPGTLPIPLLLAGRSASSLFRDEPLEERLGFRPDGLQAWPLDLPDLRRRLDGPLLRLAKRMFPDSPAQAAKAVRLTPRTFRRRLAEASSRDRIE